jgi:hypothetical protein
VATAFTRSYNRFRRWSTSARKATSSAATSTGGLLCSPQARCRRVAACLKKRRSARSVWAAVPRRRRRLRSPGSARSRAFPLAAQTCAPSPTQPWSTPSCR